MVEKIRISLDMPVRWKLIANGEKVIEQTGPDEVDVVVREGEIRGPSWIQELPALLDEAERQMRKSRRRKRRSASEVQVPTMSNDGGKKPPANKDAVTVMGAPIKGGGGINSTVRHLGHSVIAPQSTSVEAA